VIPLSVIAPLSRNLKHKNAVAVMFIKLKINPHAQLFHKSFAGSLGLFKRFTADYLAWTFIRHSENKLTAAAVGKRATALDRFLELIMLAFGSV
jgi:hypothetical protein